MRARMLTRLVILALAPLACAPPDEEAADGETPAVMDGADAGDVPVCLRGEPFVHDGSLPVADGDPGDARRVGSLRWQDHDGCERLVVDLLDGDGEPAGGAGAVTAEVLPELGVVRLELRDVEWVDPEATDARFDGDLAAGAYVIFSPEGRWVRVDVHLAGPAAAHVATLGDPARLVVDLRPDGPPLPAPAPRADRVVVLEPRPGPASYPLTVTGYARTFEANVIARLERDGEEVFHDFTTATAWVDAWGHYSFTIEDGPGGSVVLHVGEHSARDGTWQGVAIELDMR